MGMGWLHHAGSGALPVMARMVALIYNWWTLRRSPVDPLLLHGVATQTHHAGHTRLTFTSLHAKRSAIQAVLTNLAGFLRTLKATAEQWTDAERLRAILTRAFTTFMGSTAVRRRC